MSAKLWGLLIIKLQNKMVPNITFKTIAEKREFLRKLSKSVADLVKSREYNSTNTAVIDIFYKDEQHTEFKSFPEWQSEGYTVKRGSKAFLIWGKPVAKQDTTEESEQSFFPLAFLFSNAQVERKKSHA